MKKENEETETVIAEVAEEEKELIIVPVEVEKVLEVPKSSFNKESWKPKTSVGKAVKDDQIKSIDEIIRKGQKIVEPEIVDALVPDLSTDLLLIGQAKGKFGGGQRRAFRQTQKKSAEGNKPSFGTYIIVGNKNGLVGLGYGKARETVPAREKAVRQAKMNLFKIRRGCGSWQCGCKEPHSIPFAVEGKVGSCKIKFIPAPKGTGLKAQEECKKILATAGIKDIWCQTQGQSSTRINLIKACEKALRRLMMTKTTPENVESLGIREGEI